MLTIIYYNGDKPNIKIVDSYKIPCRNEQINILKEIMNDKQYSQAKRTRSLKSYLYEWRAHNFLYRIGYQKERTKDVDLNEDESMLRRIIYFILSLL